MQYVYATLDQVLPSLARLCELAKHTMYDPMMAGQNLRVTASLTTPHDIETILTEAEVVEEGEQDGGEDMDTS
jgi:hypothetical protein